jgi:hypothetical protein
MLSRAPTTITFSNEAMKANLLRLQNEWEAYQSNHERDAVYGYLAAVFELVEWWDQEGKAGNRACRALHLRGHKSVRAPEPFAAVILCTADHAKVDDRTRSKNGRGSYGTLRNSKAWMSRCEISLSAKAASTNAPRGLRVVLGEGARIPVQLEMR